MVLPSWIDSVIIFCSVCVSVCVCMLLGLELRSLHLLGRHCTT
jgi:hypothetical protein